MKSTRESRKNGGKGAEETVVQAAGQAPTSSHAKSEGGSAAVPPCPDGQCFEDVKNGSVYFEAANTLYQQGIVTGFACGTRPNEPCVAPYNRPYFRPGDPANRGVTANIGYRARTLPGINIDTADAAQPIYSRTTLDGGIALIGRAPKGIGVSAESNTSIAVQGQSNASDDAAVYGLNTGGGMGVAGNSQTGIGLLGESNTGTGISGTSIEGIGVRGETANSNVTAVYGLNTGGGTGVAGNSPAGIGLLGESNTGTALKGQTNASDRPAVHGVNTGSGGTGLLGESSTGTGVEGQSNASDHAAVHGVNTDGGAGVAGNSEKGIGLLGESNTGTAVQGTSGKGNGVLARSTEGVGIWGESANANVTAIYGVNTSGGGWGVQGVTKDGIGVQGTSQNGQGVYGKSINANGVLAESAAAAASGVYGSNSASGNGVAGYSSNGVGVLGVSDANVGVFGVSYASGVGIRGYSTSSIGIWGSSDKVHGVVGSTSDANYDGVHGFNTGAGNGVSGWTQVPKTAGKAAVLGVNAATPRGYAGYFLGDLYSTNNLQSSAATYTIDHPQDPANKYLHMAAVASPDLMNVYNGIITTDAQGEANVVLPDYVEALNTEFCYQLTVIGTFAQAIVSREYEKSAFGIRTDKPNVKVSWQLTGVRKDPFAKQNRWQVEEDKPADQRGYYLHPEAYGKPDSQGIYRELLDNSKIAPEMTLPQVKGLRGGNES